MAPRKKEWDENRENWKLRGQKLVFLRTCWGFNNRPQLIRDPRWQQIFGQGTDMTRPDNLGKYEKGQRFLNNETLFKIAKAFCIPLTLMLDTTGFDDFTMLARTEYDTHKKYAGGFGLERIIHVTSEEQELDQQLERLAVQWNTAGFPYAYIETHGNPFRPYLASGISFTARNLTPLEKAFLLIVSLHFNAGWKAWTLANKNNDIAAESVLKMLEIQYWQPRFRALYAMQHLDMDNFFLERLKKTHENRLTPKTCKTIKDHLPGKTMLAFLRQAAQDSHLLSAKKAKAVLLEIATYWGDPDMDFDTPL